MAPTFALDRQRFGVDPNADGQFIEELVRDKKSVNAVRMRRI